MKTAIRSLMLAGCCAMLANCAALRGAVPGGNALPNVDAGDALAAAKKIDEAKNKALAECGPLEKRVVAWPEERAIGGAIAIGFGTKSKGIYIDIPDKNPKALKDKVDKAGGKRDVVKLSATEKNDLNAYVQVVGASLAAGSTRPGISWTFGVIESPTVNAFSTPGGYVLVTTALMSLVENEAQLAAILAHEIGHVTGRHALNTYRNGKTVACKVALTGYYLVEAGAGNIPGGEEFVQQAKFGKTMKAFARPEGVDMDTDPDVNVEFMQWFTNQIIKLQEASGNAKEDEFDADKTAYELMASAGYDTKEFDKIVNKIPDGGGAFAHHPSNKERTDGVGKLRGEGGFGADGGKAPAFPAGVKMPPKPSS